ncbi:hypothetical protein F503_03656 [Ophiostoma piceae UAMH 11346]|uniref:Uncharacterized protein n=1 Tax=Ophiostoma piceae (strain UAMH 11346) TaxID=1262450 RepID=S3BTK5_OPHP1|nr:hypothetical protein F503_03656 [Ophiostoma piceae UAMH 11346]
MTITRSGPAKPVIGALSAQADACFADAASDVSQADPSLLSADVFSCQQMSISIDSLPGGATANVSNDVNPFDSASDSDMDWQEGPNTPSTESEGSVDVDEHVTTAQEASQDASWASNTDDNSNETTSYRFAHEPLLPAPLNPSSARPVVMQPRYLSADDHEDGYWAGTDIARAYANGQVPGHEDDSRDRPLSAFYFSLPSDRTPTPYHRESPRAQAPSRVASHAPAPYPALAPPNPFAISQIYPDETTPLFSPRNTNPFAAQPLNRRPASYHYGYQPLEPPMSPAPALYRQSPSPSPPPERMLDALHSREARDAWRRFGMNADELVPAPPLSPFSIRAPSSGNANGTGSHVGTHVSGSDTVTHEHIEHQRQLQKFVGLLSDLLNDEVRSVAKTVLELTNDFSSPRPFLDDLPDDWRARHLRTCEPIREHSAAGSQADEEPGRHWSMPRPQSMHDYMGTHDAGRSRHEQERDDRATRDGRGVRNDRDSFAPPSLARMMNDETHSDDRYSETLPPYTYRHDEPPRHSLMGSSGQDYYDYVSSQLHNY